MDKKERRLALMAIERRDMYSIVDVDYIVLKNGAKIKYEGIPDDAKLVHYYLNPEYDCIDLVLESDSFPDAPVGLALPRPFYDITSTPSETDPDIVDLTIKVEFELKTEEES